MTVSEILALRLPAAHGWRFLGAASLLATAGLLSGFLVFVNALPRAEPDSSPHTDAAVALTGGAERIGDALDLVARGGVGRLLISGVNEATSGPRLAALAPDHRGLFACCVDLGREARDTVGNAEETGAWARERGVRSLTVVTSAYHMPRSLLEMRRALPDVALVPHPVLAAGLDLDGWWRRPATARLLAGEYGKFLVAQARAAVVPLLTSRATPAKNGSKPSPLV